MDLVAAVGQLLAMSEHDPERGCAWFDELVLRFGRAPLARALQEVAGAELATLSS